MPLALCTNTAKSTDQWEAFWQKLPPKPHGSPERHTNKTRNSLPTHGLSGLGLPEHSSRATATDRHQTDRQAPDIQTDRQVDHSADRQAGRQTDRQTDRLTG